MPKLTKKQVEGLDTTGDMKAGAADCHQDQYTDAAYGAEIDEAEKVFMNEIEQEQAKIAAVQKWFLSEAKKDPKVPSPEKMYRARGDAAWRENSVKIVKLSNDKPEI